MKTEYVRDFKRNYLVICDEQVLTDNYEYKMMTKNDVSGLLRCSERMINGKVYIFSSANDFSIVNSFQTGEKTFATPAFTDGMMIVRSDKSLYCVKKM